MLHNQYLNGIFVHFIIYSGVFISLIIYGALSVIYGNLSVGGGGSKLVFDTRAKRLFALAGKINAH